MLSHEDYERLIDNFPNDPNEYTIIKVIHEFDNSFQEKIKYDGIQISSCLHYLLYK